MLKYELHTSNESISYSVSIYQICKNPRKNSYLNMIELMRNGRHAFWLRRLGTVQFVSDVLAPDNVGKQPFSLVILEPFMLTHFILVQFILAPIILAPFILVGLILVPRSFNSNKATQPSLSSYCSHRCFRQSKIARIKNNCSKMNGTQKNLAQI